MSEIELKFLLDETVVERASSALEGVETGERRPQKKNAQKHLSGHARARLEEGGNRAAAQARRAALDTDRQDQGEKSMAACRRSARWSALRLEGGCVWKRSRTYRSAKRCFAR